MAVRAVRSSAAASVDQDSLFLDYSGLYHEAAGRWTRLDQFYVRLLQTITHLGFAQQEGADEPRGLCACRFDHSGRLAPHG